VNNLNFVGNTRPRGVHGGVPTFFKACCFEAVAANEHHTRGSTKDDIGDRSQGAIEAAADFGRATESRNAVNEIQRRSTARHNRRVTGSRGCAVRRRLIAQCRNSGDAPSASNRVVCNCV
jgi:hypothetical protein